MSDGTVDRRRDRLPGLPVLGVLVVLAVLVVFPMGVNQFWTRIGLGALMWIGLAQSWNMIGGYAGYLDFGHGAYYGIGALTTGAAMVSYGLPFLAGFAIAAVVAAIIAYLVAIPTLRLTGAYFAIATWALAESLKQLALNLEVLGGTFGMSLPTDPSTFGLPVGPLSETLFYYVMLVLAVATVAVTYVLFERSEFGYRVKALRDHEDAAESLGIDTTRVKRQVYVLSCVVAAVFGSAHAYFLTFVHPNDVMRVLVTDQMVIMALLGGLGTVTGPIIGGVVVFLLQRLSSVFLGGSTIYLPMIGILIMIVVLFAPSGIVGIVRGDIESTDVRANLRELASKFDLL